MVRPGTLVVVVAGAVIVPVASAVVVLMIRYFVGRTLIVQARVAEPYHAPSPRRR